MSGKKKHHYVPRFYLKFFATDLIAKNPRTISLYNIPRKLLIPLASIGDQCAKNRFYGPSDKLEDTMSALESVWASLFEDLRSRNTLPQQKTKNHLLLLLFVSIQMLRTNRQALDTNESVRMLIKTLMAHDSRLSATGYGDFDWELKDPVFLSLRSFVDVAVCLDDLKMCLLKANPSDAFVTSDNPVFRYNFYCESFTAKGTTGAANTGLLLFLPISPEFCLLLYDGSVYKVGHRGSQEILTTTHDDVDVLNGLQYVGADSNLYFSSGLSRDYFGQLSITYDRARQEIGIRTIEAEEVGNPLSTLVHQYRHTPNLHLSLSLLSIRRKASRVPLARRINSYRRETGSTGLDPRLGSEARRFVPFREGHGRRRQ